MKPGVLSMKDRIALFNKKNEESKASTNNNSINLITNDIKNNVTKTNSMVNSTNNNNEVLNFKNATNLKINDNSKNKDNNKITMSSNKSKIKSINFNNESSFNKPSNLIASAKKNINSSKSINNNNLPNDNIGNNRSKSKAPYTINILNKELVSKKDGPIKLTSKSTGRSLVDSCNTNNIKDEYKSSNLIKDNKNNNSKNKTTNNKSFNNLNSKNNINNCKNNDKDYNTKKEEINEQKLKNEDKEILNNDVTNSNQCNTENKSDVNKILSNFDKVQKPLAFFKGKSEKIFSMADQLENKLNSGMRMMMGMPRPKPKTQETIENESNIANNNDYQNQKDNNSNIDNKVSNDFFNSKARSYSYTNKNIIQNNIKEINLAQDDIIISKPTVSKSKKKKIFKFEYNHTDEDIDNNNNNNNNKITNIKTLKTFKKENSVITMPSKVINELDIEDEEN